MLLTTDSLTKYYNKFLALSNLSMSVDEGSIVLYAGLGQPDERTCELTGHRAAAAYGRAVSQYS